MDKPPTPRDRLWQLVRQLRVFEAVIGAALCAGILWASLHFGLVTDLAPLTGQ